MSFFAHSSSTPVGRIAPAEALRLARTGDLTLVDVREVAEVKMTGRAAGALHVPLMLLAAKADPRHPEHDPRLTPDRPVAVYCASGGRSQRGAEMLAAMGYTRVYNLGGLGDWQAAGGPVER
jgi:rhodanese-related sulfurtransferase